LRECQSSCFPAFFSCHFREIRLGLHYIPALRRYYTLGSKLTHKWINRRSHRKSYAVARCLRFLQYHPLPRAKIYGSLYTLSPL
jgi:hypothetical protein